ncbi:unnamed protein product [Gadus morhua 'NCC']
MLTGIKVPYPWSTVQLSLSLARGYGTGWLSLAVIRRPWVHSQHRWELPVQVLQVLLQGGNNLNCLQASEVVATTVDEQDIRGCSSSQGL